MVKSKYAYGPNTGMFPSTGHFVGDSANVFDNVSFPTDMQINIDDEAFNAESEIAQKVKNSPAYQQAHAILSQESNPLWLQRLEAIPYSVDDAYQTGLDRIHWSNKYEDKQDANYQYCMEQISALMQEYQTWKNSLPVEQVNQLAQAGINSAVTGQQISGSQIPNVGVGSNPSALESTNVGDVILGAADFMLSAVGGFADLASKFATLRLTKNKQDFDIKLAERSFITQINQYAREHGIKFGFEDGNRELRGFSDFGNFDITDPQGQSIQLKQLFEAAKTFKGLSPLIANAILNDKDGNLARFVEGYTDDEVIFGDSVGVSRSIALDAVTTAQWDLHQATLHFDAYKAKYDLDITEYTADSAEYKSKTDEFIKEKTKYEKEIEGIKYNLIDSLRNSSNEDDKLLLMKILNNVNASDIEILKQAANFAVANAAVGIIKGIL